MSTTRLEAFSDGRSEEHTSELQSRSDLVCRLLLEKKTARWRRSPRVSVGRYSLPRFTQVAPGPAWRSASTSRRSTASSYSAAPPPSIFFFTDTAAAESCTLSRHDALPI